jgi:hypothetical protein
VAIRPSWWCSRRARQIAHEDKPYSPVGQVPFDFILSLRPPALVPNTVGESDDESTSRKVLIGRHCRGLDERDPRCGLTVKCPPFVLWRIEYLDDDWHEAQQDVVKVLPARTWRVEDAQSDGRLDSPPPAMCCLGASQDLSEAVLELSGLPVFVGDGAEVEDWQSPGSQAL